MTFGQDMDDISCDSPSLVDTSKRVDFISELPLEIVVECIVPRIMEYHGRAFNLIGRQNYFAVCTTWSKRIAENNDSIHFNLESDRLSSKLDFMRVKAVAPYIKTLIVVTRSVASIFKLVHYGQLSSLHNLTIKETGFHLAWMQLLGSIPNLKCLCITFKEKANSLQLCDMLNQCPTLIQLRISIAEDFSLTSSLYPKPMYPNIRHLEVSYDPPGPSMHIQFFEYFSGLRLLRLTDPPSNQEAVYTLSQYCPNLQQVFLGNHSDVSDTIRHHDDWQQGFQLLSIHDTPLHWNLFEDIIRYHHTTLESFALQGYFSNCPPIAIFADDGIVFSQLRSLRLPRNLKPHAMGVLEWMISHAPNMEYVESICGGVRGRILNALLSRPVRTVTLECSELSTHVDEKRFLNHHVQLGRESSLQNVKCTIFNLLYEGADWVFLIPLLQQLKTLELDVTYNNNVRLLNALFAAISRGCKSLEKLTLAFRPFPFSILPLSEHPRLKHLVIDSFRLPNGIIISLRRFQHLDSLHLKLRYYDQQRIVQLKRDIPHVAIRTQK